MRLNSIKRDMDRIKEKMENGDDPSIPGFFKWCESHYYHRPVNMGELWFSEYILFCPDGSRTKVKSNTALFLKLSDKYFNQIHNTDNPIKEKRDLSFKHILSIRWFEKCKPNYTGKVRDMVKDSDFNTWFDKKWDEFLKTEDLSVFEDF